MTAYDFLNKNICVLICCLTEGRSGCEFWKRTTVIGDPVEGLRTTLTASQKGISTDIGELVVSMDLLSRNLNYLNLRGIT